MATHGSENRQRAIILKARFTEAEAALIKEQASRSGVSVSAVLRHGALNQKPLRASRTPPIDRALAAQLLAALGENAAVLREAADASGQSAPGAQIDAMHRDLAELRAVLLEALGRRP